MDKKYVVDRIEENIVVLEDLETKERIEVEQANLTEIKEGNILNYNGVSFEKENNLEEQRRESIREKMERLKALKRENNG